MNEIALRARVGTLPPMLAKARTLLTRFWAKANWEARSEILAAARMLLTLGAAQPALRPPRVAAPARSASTPAVQPASAPPPGRRKAPPSPEITEEVN